MHSFYSAVLASLFAQGSVAFTTNPAPVRFEDVSEYWCVSRSRIDLWEQAILRLRRAESTKDYDTIREWWNTHHELIEEVFATEPLTRVLAASIGEAKILEREGTLAPVVDSIFLLHHDLSSELRRAMLRHQLGAAQEFFQGLNRVRLASQKWNDMLMAWMTLSKDFPTTYMFAEENVVSLSKEFLAVGDYQMRSSLMKLMTHSELTHLRRVLTTACMLPQANRDVLNAAIALLGASPFDDRGVFKDPYSLREMLSQSKEDRKPIDPDFKWHVNLKKTFPNLHTASPIPVGTRWYSL